MQYSILSIFRDTRSIIRMSEPASTSRTGLWRHIAWRSEALARQSVTQRPESRSDGRVSGVRIRSIDCRAVAQLLLDKKSISHWPIDVRNVTRRRTQELGTNGSWVTGLFRAPLIVGAAWQWRFDHFIPQTPLSQSSVFFFDVFHHPFLQLYLLHLILTPEKTCQGSELLSFSCQNSNFFLFFKAACFLLWKRRKYMNPSMLFAHSTSRSFSAAALYLTATQSLG